MKKILALLGCFLALNGQVLRPPGTNPGTTGQQISISQVTGLQAELDARPRKGATYSTSKASVVDDTGKIGVPTGADDDCVRVDGTASPCTGGGEGDYDPADVNSVTWGNGSQATVTQTFNATGSTNATWEYSDGVANLSVGTLEVGGFVVFVTEDATATPTTDKLVRSRDDAAEIDRGWLPEYTGDTGTGGAKGAVPAPAIGDANKCLKGDGTWGTCSGDSSSVTPGANLVPKADGAGKIATGWLPTGIDAANIGAGGVSNAEFGHMDGVTSAVQTQLDAKAPSSGINATAISGGAIDNTEFGHLDGVTSGIQGQFTSKQSTSQKDQASGYAGLDGSSKLTRSQLPVMTGDGGSGGLTGSVPAPATGDASKCLKGNATWGDCSAGTGIGTNTVDVDALDEGVDSCLVNEFVRIDSSDANMFQCSTYAQVATALDSAGLATDAAVSAKQDALGYTAENTANKNGTNGYAGLSSGLVAASQLPAMVGDSGSGGTKGAAPAPASGDAAAGKFLKADGTWAVPSGGGGGLGTDTVVVDYLNSTDTGVSGDFVRIDSNTTRFVYDTAAAVATALDSAGLATDAALTSGLAAKQDSLGYTAENTANKGATNGYAALSSGKVPVAQLPVMVGDSGSGGTAGLVPAPTAGQSSLCLKGSGQYGACGSGGGGGGAPTDAEYVTFSSHGGLDNELRWTADGGVLATKSGANLLVKVDCSYVGCQGDDVNFTGNNRMGVGNLFADYSLLNHSIGGTELGKLVELVSTGKARTATGATGIVGIAALGAGTTGSVRVAYAGTIPCSFDNSPSALDWVVPGASGTCHAQATRPTSGVIIGRVLDAVSLGGKYNVLVRVDEL